MTFNPFSPQRYFQTFRKLINSGLNSVAAKLLVNMEYLKIHVQYAKYFNIHSNIPTTKNRGSLHPWSCPRSNFIFSLKITFRNKIQARIYWSLGSRVCLFTRKEDKFYCKRRFLNISVKYDHKLIEPSVFCHQSILCKLCSDHLETSEWSIKSLNAFSGIGLFGDWFEF